jgi:hypothetical protein
MKKLKIVIYLVVVASHDTDIMVGTVVVGRSAGAIGRNSHCHHCHARSAQWRAGDLYRLLFIGSG